MGNTEEYLAGCGALPVLLLVMGVIIAGLLAFIATSQGGM